MRLFLAVQGIIFPQDYIEVYSHKVPATLGYTAAIMTVAVYPSVAGD